MQLLNERLNAWVWQLIAQPVVKLKANHPAIFIDRSVIIKQVSFAKPRMITERRLCAHADCRRKCAAVWRRRRPGVNAIGRQHALEVAEICGWETNGATALVATDDGGDDFVRTPEQKFHIAYSPLRKQPSNHRTTDPHDRLICERRMTISDDNCSESEFFSQLVKRLHGAGTALAEMKVISLDKHCGSEPIDDPFHEFSWFLTEQFASRRESDDFIRAGLLQPIDSLMKCADPAENKLGPKHRKWMWFKRQNDNFSPNPNGPTGCINQLCMTEVHPVEIAYCDGSCRSHERSP